MDIDRLNRIREICFKKSKSKTRKHHAGETVRSPFSSRRDGKIFTNDKENYSLESSQQLAIELKKQNVTKDVYKNLEKQVSEMY